ncbi:titin isoform X8 [Atheta coriaria]|uniref:titin isoform X8 n=1 Tax=Dalotia coriaria TaxID=877792 RepID=UPI0031F3CC7B
MMAETVKKSRIVSDDDLEESLMQEFNKRLKTCISSEGLNDDDEEDDDDNHYENVQVVASNTNSNTNGNHDNIDSLMTDLQLQPLQQNENLSELSSLGTKNKLDSVEEFIQIERECLNLEVMPPEIQLGENNGNGNDHMVQVRTPPDNEEEPEAEGEYKPLRTFPVVQNIEVDSSPEKTGITARDRMLLSTDSASCLLFTQTVTSPMLTPSDERVDFMKGFTQAGESAETSPPTTVSEDQDPDNQDDKDTFEQIEVVDNQEPEQDPDQDQDQDLDPTEPEVDQQDAEIDQPEVDQLMEDYPEEELQEIENIQPEVDQVDRSEVRVEKSPDLLRDVPVIQVTSTSQNQARNKNGEYQLVETKISNYEREVMTSPNSRPISTTPTDLDCKLPSVKSLKDQYIKTASTEVTTPTSPKFEKGEMSQLKSLDIMKQISKFEQISPSKEESTEVTESSYVETTVVETSVNGDGQVQQAQQVVQKKKTKKKSRTHANEKENISVKSSFSKFDALQKKNVLHVRSSDSSKAQEKFNGNQADTSNCKSCGKIVFQMEQMKAERSIWHKNCFRCTECNKQLTVDTYQSHEGTLYCKPHFKALFAPKVVEDDKDSAPQKPRKHELIIRENQPEELPPDVVRASDKPDLGLEELQSLNVKERFQVFEHHHEEEHGLERTSSTVNVKRSPSILSKLARFQAKGMDIGVGDESLNGIPIEESSTEDEHEVEEEEDEDADLVRAKRAQREKPFHFTGMSDVKNKWEHGEQNGRDERREERKQEIQNIRNRLFMGKQGKMKEMYQQAVMESESGANVKRTETIEKSDTAKSIKERFEKGEVEVKSRGGNGTDDEEVFESEISKKSRSIFKELDANATKAPPMIPAQKSASKIFNRQASNVSTNESAEVVKSTMQQEDVTVQTAAIQQRFKFFETYREPELERKRFRITPPRDGQVKMESPDREVYRDPEVIRAEEQPEDSGVAVKTQTAKKMLNKFRQMEEDLSRDQVHMGPKPLKRFTPPPEPIRSEEESEEEASESMDEESDQEHERNGVTPDGDLLEAQKAARAKQLRAKFEKWEANEIKREQNNSSVNIVEEFGDEQSQVESTKSLRARFESMKGQQREDAKVARPKVNRFVNTTLTLEACQDCQKRVYPLEKISVHGAIYHKKCFKCMECNTILRMDSYSYNQGRLYCTPHFKRLFITKGNYDTAFGLEQHKEKWNASVA